MPSFLAGLGNGLGTLVGGAGNAGAASSNAWNYGQYSPYTVNNPMGQTSFNGTTANSTLSPLQQQIQGSLGNNVLQGGGQGPGTAPWLSQQYSNIFDPSSFNSGVQNQFQNSVNGIMPFLQQAGASNLDNEFSKGTLASTAGQYQTAGFNQGLGATLSGLQNQAFQNQLGLSNSRFGAAQGATSANQNLMGQSLSGLNQQNTSFLQQLQAAGNLGAQRSGANVAAATPGIETGNMQDNATAGLLSGLLFGGGSQGGLLSSLLGTGGGGGGGGLAGGLGGLGSLIGKGLGGLFGGNSASAGGGSGGGIGSGLNTDGGLNDMLNQLGNGGSGSGGLSNWDQTYGMQNVQVDPVNLTDEGASSNWWD